MAPFSQEFVFLIGVLKPFTHNVISDTCFEMLEFRQSILLFVLFQFFFYFLSSVVKSFPFGGLFHFLFLFQNVLIQFSVMSICRHFFSVISPRIIIYIILCILAFCTLLVSNIYHVKWNIETLEFLSWHSGNESNQEP